MMTVKDDLIAAKALIDTPEKWASIASVREVCNSACIGEFSHIRASAAFGAFLAQPGTGRGIITLPEILDRFDRAIEAAS